MKTGATKAQIEDALIRRLAHRRHRGYGRASSNPKTIVAYRSHLNTAAIALVPATLRIVSVTLLTRAWERITAQANLSEEDAALADALKAAFEGNRQ